MTTVTTDEGVRGCVNKYDKMFSLLWFVAFKMNIKDLWVIFLFSSRFCRCHAATIVLPSPCDFFCCSLVFFEELGTLERFKRYGNSCVDTKQEMKMNCKSKKAKKKKAAEKQRGFLGWVGYEAELLMTILTDFMSNAQWNQIFEMNVNFFIYSYILK